MKSNPNGQLPDEPVVRKIAERSEPADVGISLQPVQKREVVLSVEANSQDNMRKQATVRIEHPKGSTFQIICDEGPYLGGDDSAPPPLAYYASAVTLDFQSYGSRLVGFQCKSS